MCRTLICLLVSIPCFSALHAITRGRIEEQIIALIDSSPDGQLAGQLVRLAYADSATFDPANGGSGGSRACIRFSTGGEARDEENGGLLAVTQLLAPIQAQYRHKIGFADLYALAAVTAISHAGGPSVPYSWGRIDCDAPEVFTAGRLASPDPQTELSENPVSHLRSHFSRLGIDDRGIVTLMGAHTLGRARFRNRGWDGAWTTRPDVFNNEYFRSLKDDSFPISFQPNSGVRQGESSKGTIMMPIDLALRSEPLDEYVEEFADDQDAWFEEFAFYMQTMQEAGWENELFQTSGILTFQGFESWIGPVDGWHTSGVEASRREGIGADGSHASLAIRGSESPLGVNQGFVYRLATAEKTDTVGFFVRIETSASSNDTGLHVTDESGRYVTRLEISDGRLMARGGSTSDQIVGTIPVGRFVEVEISFDWRNRETLTQVGTADPVRTPFVDSNAENVRQVRFFHESSASTLFLDEVIVTKERQKSELPSRGFGAWWHMLLVIIGVVLACCAIFFCYRAWSFKRRQTKGTRLSSRN